MRHILKLSMANHITTYKRVFLILQKRDDQVFVPVYYEEMPWARDLCNAVEKLNLS